MRQEKKGFTLAEMAIVIGIMLLMAALTLPFYGFFNEGSVLDSAKHEVLETLRLAQARAQAQDGAGPFGVTFGPTSYTLEDPAGDQVLSLPQNVTLTGLSSVAFAAHTGIPSQAGFVTVSHEQGSQRFIYLNEGGLIYEVLAGQGSLLADKDTFIRQGTPTINYGTHTQLQVYPWNIGQHRRALVGFELGGIPPGATVNSATLYLKEATTYGVTRTIGAHRLTQSWDEGGATWLQSDEVGTPWGSAGGSFVATATDTAEPAWGGVLEWDSWDVTADVQAFADGTYENYGWLLKDASEDASQQYWFFSSSRGADAPYLEIDYSL